MTSAVNETYSIGLEKVGNEETEKASIGISWPQYRVCILDDIIIYELMLLTER